VSGTVRWGRRTAALVLVAAAVASITALAASATVTGGAKVKTRATSLGRIVVNVKGRSLYAFEKDTHGKSACYGQCANYWPPLLTRGKPVAGAGVKAALLGVTRRKDGTRQVTYAGHPLYRYTLDTRAGQTTGEGSTLFGAGWDAVAPSGKKIESD
jgi:predicted lipoprotein with Yx(FWY)xxD motif